MAVDTRIHVTLEYLRSMEAKARGLSFLPRQPSASVLNGKHASKLRGRGLNFEEMRHYLPGDDIRSIDWKATARTGTPHVRVFTEERDRPALLVIDQRMSMFFGSVLNMKSVTAAEAAALSAFTILDAGDRVGGIVFDDEQQCEVKPQRSAQAVYQLLEQAASMNQALHADRTVHEQPGGLNDVLKSVARIAHHDHLVIIFSDFDGIDDHTHRHLSGIALHNDLVLCLVHDPSAFELGGGGQLVVGDGKRQTQVDLNAGEARTRLQNFSIERIDRIRRWEQEINLSLLPLSAGEDTLKQVQRLLGGMSPRRRVR